MVFHGAGYFTGVGQARPRQGGESRGTRGGEAPEAEEAPRREGEASDATSLQLVKLARRGPQERLRGR